jgi:ADP-heptose:LPS heptosyltransferase
MSRTVVILHPGGFGDLLLAVPAIHGLRERFPSRRLLLCGQKEASRFLAECGLVDDSVSVQSTACTALFGGRRPDDPLLLDWLSRCDCAVAWTRDDSGGLAATLQDSGAAVAVVQSPFASTLTGVHQSERYAEIVGVQPPSIPQVSVPEALKAEAQAYLGSRAPGRRPVALVHPGSGSRHKCVKPEIILPVLEGLEAEGLEPLLLQGPADGEVIERLLLHVPRRPIVLDGLSVRVLAGVLSEVELFLGHDSGVTHLAALLGTPTVALFGPTDPGRWAPRGSAVAVIKEKPCGCLGWDAVRRCQEKPCLDVSPSAILHACLTTRAEALNPRIC